MEPDERLDALLSQRQREGESSTQASLDPVAGGHGIGGDWHEESAEVNALLHAADRFAVWGSAEPSPTFVDQLEAQLLARFVVRAEDDIAYEPMTLPVPWSDQEVGAAVDDLSSDGHRGLNGSTPASAPPPRSP